MEQESWWKREGPLVTRVLVAIPVGLAVWGWVRSTPWGLYAPAIGWIAGGTAYLLKTWAEAYRWRTVIATKHHAAKERSTRLFTDVVVIVASLASLVGVGYVLTAGSKHGAETAVASGVGVAMIVVAWLAVHTMFSMRYAYLYYSNTPPGGVNFHEKTDPSYVDFFYLAFTIGMTYQVSDTELGSRRLRGTALRQALLSYVFGAVILAITINLIASLSGGRG
jgi:uncharacterized membrane protein